MFFSRPSIFALYALYALVRAEDMDQLKSDFATISSTDTAAFSRWVNSYVDACKTYVASKIDVYKTDTENFPQFLTLENELNSMLDREKTYQYSDFYNAWYATTDNYHHNMTAGGDIYETFDDFGTDFETAYPYETGGTEFWDGFYPVSETGSSVGDGAYGAIAATASVESHITSVISASKIRSSFASASSNSKHISGSEASHDSSTLNSLASSQHGTHVASSSFSTVSSVDSSRPSSTGSSSAGVGIHQAPMIVGAALAGISVLLL